MNAASQRRRFRVRFRLTGASEFSMHSPRDIRRRIRSISSTAQITKAMQMVAASKMRKAQQAALAGRPFVQLLYRIQRAATTHAGRVHPSAAGGARSPQTRGHPDRRGQGPVRGAQQQPVPPGRPVRSRSPRFSSRPGARPPNSSPAPPAAGRRVYLRGHAAVPRGQSDCRLCLRPFLERGGGPGPCRRDALRQHADPASCLSRVSSGGRNQRDADPGGGSPKRNWQPTPPSSCSSPARRPSWAICSRIISISTSIRSC